jgi:large subunit ribosomal protein L25
LRRTIRISIPLHFTGAAISPGVKSQGGIVSHMRNEAEVSCLPKDLPEFIEVDISGLSLNESIHLSQLKLPPGVTLVELAKDDAAVVAIHSPRAEEPEPTAAAAVGAEGAAVAGAAAPAGAPAAAGAAAPAAGGDAAKKAEPAKKEEAKKEPAKKDAKK